MHNEFKLRTQKGEINIILQGGFYISDPTDHIHKHINTEIHLVLGSGAIYSVDYDTYITSEACMVVIPQGVYHSCKRTPDSIHIAFLLEYDVSKFVTYDLNPHILKEFIAQIKQCIITNDHNLVLAYLQLFISHLDQKPIIPTKTPPNPYVTISDFFTQNYNKNIQLSDLSKLLHLSERQTERLLVKYTGNTFKKELISTRKYVAEYLSLTTAMSLSDIANYVGYNTYSGFYKAVKKSY